MSAKSMTSSNKAGGSRSVARRASYVATGSDDFPTPPWVTRAFFEYVAPELTLSARRLVVLEPACGRGHMVSVLRDLKFKTVMAYDQIDYLKGFPEANYIDPSIKFPPYDLMLTNPPYKLASKFALRALREARWGVALLVPTLWLEGGKDHPRSRYELIFRNQPPTVIATLSARMPAAHGRVVQHRAVFRSHSWFWWNLTRTDLKQHGTRWMLIPPDAQARLEREEDYR